MSLFLSNDYSNVSNNSNTQLNNESGQGQTSYKIASLVSGQQISGEVIQIDQNNIQIALDQNTVISAKMEQGIHLLLNSPMTFEVNKTKDSQITLRPLFINTAQTQTILQALSQAGIASNAENVDMISKMMQSGLSIDKNSVLDMYHQFTEYPDTDKNIIMEMTRLNLPINEATVEQYIGYQNMENQLTNACLSLTDQIELAYNDIKAEYGVESADDFLQKMIEVIIKPEIEAVHQKPVSEQIQMSDTIKPMNLQTAVEEQKIPDMSGQTAFEKDQIMNKTQYLNTEENVNTVKGLNIGESLNTADFTKTQEKVNIVEQFNALINGNRTENMKPDDITEAEKTNGTQILKTALLSENVHEHSGIKELISHIKSVFMEQWTLNPKEWIQANGKNTAADLERVYEEIRNTANRISKALQNTVAENSTLAKSAVSLKNNVDFLYQMNQNYTYFQLPLKLSGQYHNSELYVYSRKKNLTSFEEELTALVHLDMNFLGPVDVYVRLKEENVSTNFMLQDEETINFISAHLDTLDKRLEEKGYHTHSEVTLKQKPFSVCDELRSESGVRSQTMNNEMYHYSFDIRA